jgi:hypothetical protein
MKEPTPNTMAAEKPVGNGPFSVFVDDNGRYMDEEARYRAGVFPDYPDAVKACREMVDDFLLANYEPGMDAANLFDTYTSFGKDPWIKPRRPIVEGEKDDYGADFAALKAECLASPDYLAGVFSAWAYAEKRAGEICATAGENNGEEAKP